MTTDSKAVCGGGEGNSSEPVTILYTNWRGETAVRKIVPHTRHPVVSGKPSLWFGSTQWHPEPQWLLTAVDVEKGAVRDWALSGIKAWGEEAVSAALASTAGAGAGDWVTVPRKITMPMGMKFYEHRARDEDAQFCWEAMIEAAPAVPASPRSGAGDGEGKPDQSEAVWDYTSALQSVVWHICNGRPITDDLLKRAPHAAGMAAKFMAAQSPAPAEHGVEIRAARSRWLDWRGAVEGIERSKEIAAQAVRQVRENGGDDTNQDLAETVCWMLGLDHLWQHVEALRAALAAKQAPDVATALRQEANRLIAKADDLTAALSQGGGAGRSEKGEGEGLERVRSPHAELVADGLARQDPAPHAAPPATGTWKTLTVSARPKNTAPCHWGGGNDIIWCLTCGAQYAYAKGEERPPCPRSAAPAQSPSTSDREG